eukprot:gene17362-22910_t
MSNYRDLIESTAIKAAKLAGEIILSGYGSINLQNDIISKIGSRDIVTNVDKASQKIIYDTINDVFPNHDFLGEEDVDPVDPLDGTTNFAHAIPLSGVIIAYAENGITLFGLIYDPFRNELFTAWKNNDSVICSGSPPNIKSLDACLRGMLTLSPKVRTVRLLGSAAIMLSWVACGRITAYYEADLNVWDLAAGALIIEEAGGIVTDVHRTKFTLKTRNLVASNKHIYNDLIIELQASKMWIE